MRTFEIDLYDGHLIFENNGQKILLDTGSPVTISRNNTLEFMDMEHSCVTSMGVDIEKISDLLGYRIDTLLGLDILRKYYIEIDYKNKKVTFYNEATSFDSQIEVPITGKMGTICMELETQGHTLDVAIDTGAKISYINNRYTENKNSIDVRDDFHPIIGNFQTPIYEMEGSVGGKTFPIEFGVLPDIYSNTLEMIGISGVIGFDLFNSFTAYIDLTNNKMHLKQ